MSASPPPVIRPLDVSTYLETLIASARRDRYQILAGKMIYSPDDDMFLAFPDLVNTHFIQLS